MFELMQNNPEATIAILVAIISAITFIVRSMVVHRIETLKEKSELELQRLEQGLQSKHEKELELFRKEINEKNKASIPARIEQLEKIAYVKYIHIATKIDKPIYSKRLLHNGKLIDVYSENLYFRFNRFNSSSNSITIKDRSGGAVDTNILFPWRELIYTDSEARKMNGYIDQELSGQDSYLTTTSYYNGFTRSEPTVGMKMEADTQNARLIADFSSVMHLDKIITNKPKVYRRNWDGEKEIFGLETLDKGVFHIHVTNLKKGEVVYMLFPVSNDFQLDIERRASDSSK